MTTHVRRGKTTAAVHVAAFLAGQKPTLFV